VTSSVSSTQVVNQLNSQLTLAATSHMRAAGHLDAAADLLAQHGARTGGSGPDLLIARASLRIDQVLACLGGCSPFQKRMQKAPPACMFRQWRRAAKRNSCETQHIVLLQLGAASGGADAKRAAGYVRAEVKQLEAARAGAADAAHAHALLLLQGQAHRQLYRQGCEAFTIEQQKLRLLHMAHLLKRDNPRLMFQCRHGTEPAQHLPAAFRCIQGATSGDGAAMAAEVAQASLQLALLADEVLQVCPRRTPSTCIPGACPCCPRHLQAHLHRCGRNGNASDM
jgi:hypothetical protein